jgi:hypothetical protein
MKRLLLTAAIGALCFAAPHGAHAHNAPDCVSPEVADKEYQAWHNYLNDSDHTPSPGTMHTICRPEASWSQYAPQYLPGRTYLTCNGALEAMKVARATMTANQRQGDIQPYVDAVYTIVDAFYSIQKGGCLTPEKTAEEQYTGDNVNGEVTSIVKGKDDDESHFREINDQIDILMGIVKHDMKPSFVSRFLGLFN